MLPDEDIVAIATAWSDLLDGAEEIDQARVARDPLGDVAAVDGVLVIRYQDIPSPVEYTRFAGTPWEATVRQRRRSLSSWSPTRPCAWRPATPLPFDERRVTDFWRRRDSA